jgi:hypothetical protein
VLFLWLFGLGSGIANACLTAGPADAASWPAFDSVGVMAPHPDAAAHEGAHHHHGTGSAHDGLTGHHGTIAKTNCQDFCGKASVSIAPLKSALDDVQAHALMATVFTTTALPVPEFAPVRLRVPRRDGVQAPPIPIAFLRLAL